MAYSRTHTIDSGPSGDTVKAAIAVKLDGDLTNIFTYLNEHDVATTNIHGLESGTVCGTTNAQTLENKTIVNPVISGSISNASIVTPTFSGAITSGNATFNGGTLSGVTMTGTITASGATLLTPTFSGAITSGNATFNGGTLSGVTMTGTITGSNATFNGGTLSGVTMTGTITASGATIISPTITGGTITQSTIDGITHTAQTTGFTIEGGTASKKLTLDADVRASVVAATFYGYKNLAIDYVSASTATVTADEVFLQNSDGFIKRFTSLSETVDITKSGANGLDTGSEAVSTWYHIWAIGKEDGTLDCLLSLSATAPTMPAGYTYKIYLGAVYNNASGNFNEMYQRNNEVVCATVVVVNGGTSTTFASTSLAAAIPATARSIFGKIGNKTTSGTTQLSPLSSGNSYVNYYVGGVAGQTPYRIPVITAQTVWYKMDTAGGKAYLAVDGWGY